MSIEISSVVVNERLATEVFEFVFYSQPTVPDADPVVRRLDLRHLGVLCELLGLRLDDLSCYVLLYLLRCRGDVPLTVMEYEFVKGLERMISAPLPSLPRRDNNYAPIFSAMRREVYRCNAVLRSRDVAPQHHVILTQFYNFIYNFLLRHYPKDFERRPLALEVWGMFYDDLKSSQQLTGEATTNHSSSSSSSSSSSEAVFAKYVPFRHYHLWAEFVLSPSFTNRYFDEEEGVERGGYRITADLWQQLLLFAALEDYSQYDFYGSWPSAIDHFVATQLALTNNTTSQ